MKEVFRGFRFGHAVAVGRGAGLRAGVSNRGGRRVFRRLADCAGRGAGGRAVHCAVRPGRRRAAARAQGKGNRPLGRLPGALRVRAGYRAWRAGNSAAAGPCPGFARRRLFLAGGDPDSVQPTDPCVLERHVHRADGEKPMEQAGAFMVCRGMRAIDARVLNGGRGAWQRAFTLSAGDRGSKR